MKPQIHAFSKDVKESLGFYVYLLLDPDTRKPFYIGKGKGDRIFHHLKDQNTDSEKVQKIDELRKLGKEPILEILKWGLNEDEALLVESTAIDLLGIDALTNSQRGHGSKHGSRTHVNDLELELCDSSGDIKFNEPGILIRISKRWRYDMTPRPEQPDPKRLEFVGVIAAENIRKKYIGKDVSKYFPKGAANPIQYVGFEE